MYEYEKDHIAKLRPYLPECCVLLKKNGAFPLDGPCRIAAYGNGVRDTLKGGTGSGEVNSKYYVTVEMALADAGFELINTQWLRDYEKVRAEAKKVFRKKLTEGKKGIAGALISAMGASMPEPEYELSLDFSADAAIYVRSRICGEGSDRQVIKGDFLLTETEIGNILALDAAYDKFMLVINTGGPVDLAPVASVGNILVLS